MNNMKLYPNLTMYPYLTLKTELHSPRWKLIQLLWVSSGFSTAVNMRSGRAMKNSARPVSSPSWSSFQSLRRTTGAFSASGRMRLGDRRRLASSRWRTFQISGFLDFWILFQIVPTGKPSPLTACQIVNKTLTSLKVQCQEGKSLFGAFCRQPSVFISGFDGGLPANFLLELYDAEKMELKSQVTNKVPIFEVPFSKPGGSANHRTFFEIFFAKPSQVISQLIEWCK